MSTALESLKIIYERDLNTLKKELNAYQNEADMWTVQGNITNSAGNLFLHLCGNLKHFIGAVLGGTDYIREREREFNDKNISRADMATNLDETMAAVMETLTNLDPQKLDEDFPINVFGGKPLTTHAFLLHLSGHLMYHMGQINYHRRLLEA